MCRGFLFYAKSEVMITKERQQTIRNSQMLKFRERQIDYRVPEGLVYQGEHMALYCRGGWASIAKYYITTDRVMHYLLVADRVGITALQGLAICKAFDLYTKDEFSRLLGPQRSRGYISTYVRDIASRLIKMQWPKEKDMMNEVIRINESNLKP